MRTSLLILLLGSLLTAALLPFDSTLTAMIDTLNLPGDFRREWLALQQFGQGVSIAIICIIVFVQSPHLRKRLIDFGLALAAVGAAVTVAKLLIGRPRPRFGDSSTFLFPWGTYPLPVKHPAPGQPSTISAHAWQLSIDAVEQLWSMPSSHTAFAVVTAIFLSSLYPRLKWLWIILAFVVATGRLVFDAHWPSDVAAGATVAIALTWPILRSGPKLPAPFTGDRSTKPPVSTAT